MRDILTQTGAWLAEGKPVAIATVVSTWGSAPRQTGAKLTVTPPHGMVGSVSGGCVEGAVIDEAIASLNDYLPRVLHFGVADDTAWEVGLACGGEIDIYVEPLDSELFEVLRERTNADIPHVSVTIISGDGLGTKVVADADGLPYAVGDPDALDTLTAAAFIALDGGKTGRATLGGYDVFIEVMQPRPHLIVIGGAHIAIALTQIADLLGFRISLIDPRRAFASAERFPHLDGRLHHAYPDKILHTLELDTYSYIVILSHDPKIDDPALHLALSSPASYVGILSSRKTHAQRITRLMADGIPSEQLARIHTPIGLDIGAKTPEEIALSIMAEILSVKNRRALS
jgi:xanthine dehydrogenase accessory factor